MRPEDEVLLASGTSSQVAGTIDVSALLPAAATLAYLRFSAYAGGTAVDCTIRVRPDATGGWTEPLHLIPIQGAADTASNDSAEWTLLSANRTFDLEVLAHLNPYWSVTLLGWT